MIKTAKTAFSDGTTNVVVNAYVQNGYMKIDPLQYCWEGKAGSVAAISIPLTSDPAKPMAYLAILYENAQTKERKVVTDGHVLVIPPTDAPLDHVMLTQGWRRCFMLAQLFVPPGASLDSDSGLQLEVTQFVQVPNAKP